MKQAILIPLVIALGLSLYAGTTTIFQTTSNLGCNGCRVDDPPPEPVECPMCGGNAQVHARRLLVIQEHMDCVALLATRW